jgi:hypothetical protein
LSCKGKITKKGLHRPFFLSIVVISGEKWVLVGNFCLIRVVLIFMATSDPRGSR